MDSSDSEDDCYSNMAQKLQRMKNKYIADKVECTNLLNDSAEIDEIVKKADFGAKTEVKSVENIKKVEGEPSSVLTSDDIDAIVESIASRRVTRSSKRSCSFTVIEEDPVPKTTKRRGRGNANQPSSTAESSSANSSGDNCSSASSRGRGSAARSRASPRGRGRGNRGSRSRRRARGGWFPSRSSYSDIYPIYSIGNTDEYPDECYDQTLFSNPKPQSDVVMVEEEEDPLEDNEELSVKVYWQSSEYFKFTIRKYQKLTQIFEYFSKMANVENNKLLFTYNDRILTSDDTPESINYNIAKFIDGGIVNQSITKLVPNKQDDVKDGIKIKFQCQNIKKPYETVIRLDDKLSVAMVKCAEHFEKPLDKLRFEFDGDIISGDYLFPFTIILSVY